MTQPTDEQLIDMSQGLKIDPQALDWPENLAIYGRRVWSEAWRVAIEEAAKVAENAGDHYDGCENNIGADQSEIAADIRALADRKPE